jgi:hypothetical protein
LIITKKVGPGRRGLTTQSTEFEEKEVDPMANMLMGVDGPINFHDFDLIPLVDHSILTKSAYRLNEDPPDVKARKRALYLQHGVIANYIHPLSWDKEEADGGIDGNEAMKEEDEEKEYEDEAVSANANDLLLEQEAEFPPDDVITATTAIKGEIEKEVQEQEEIPSWLSEEVKKDYEEEFSLSRPKVNQFPSLNEYQVALQSYEKQKEKHQAKAAGNAPIDFSECNSFEDSLRMIREYEAKLEEKEKNRPAQEIVVYPKPVNKQNRDNIACRDHSDNDHPHINEGAGHSYELDEEEEVDLRDQLQEQKIAHQNFQKLEAEIIDIDTNDHDEETEEIHQLDQEEMEQQQTEQPPHQKDNSTPTTESSPSKRNLSSEIFSPYSRWNTSNPDEVEFELEDLRLQLRTPASIEVAKSVASNYFQYPDPRDYDRFREFQSAVERMNYKRERCKKCNDFELEVYDDIDDEKYRSFYYTDFDANPYAAERKIRAAKNLVVNALRKVDAMTSMLEKRKEKKLLERQKKGFFDYVMFNAFGEHYNKQQSYLDGKRDVGNLTIGEIMEMNQKSSTKLELKKLFEIYMLQEVEKRKKANCTDVQIPSRPPLVHGWEGTKEQYPEDEEDIDFKLFPLTEERYRFREEPDPRDDWFTEGSTEVWDESDDCPWPQLVRFPYREIPESEWKKTEKHPMYQSEKHAVKRRKVEHVLIRFLTGIDLERLQEEIDEVMHPDYGREREAWLEYGQPMDIFDVWHQHLDAMDVLKANHSSFEHQDEFHDLKPSYAYPRIYEGRVGSVEEKEEFQKQKLKEYQKYLSSSDSSVLPRPSRSSTGSRSSNRIAEPAKTLSVPTDSKNGGDKEEDATPEEWDNQMFFYDNITLAEKERLNYTILLPDGFRWSPEEEFEEMRPYPNPLSFSSLKDFQKATRQFEKQKKARRFELLVEEEERARNSNLYLPPSEYEDLMKRKGEYYRSLTRSELEEILKRYSLPAFGKKPALVQRLLDNQEVIVEKRIENKMQKAKVRAELEETRRKLKMRKKGKGKLPVNRIPIEKKQTTVGDRASID